MTWISTWLNGCASGYAGAASILLTLLVYNHSRSASVALDQLAPLTLLFGLTAAVLFAVGARRREIEVSA